MGRLSTREKRLDRVEIFTIERTELGYKVSIKYTIICNMVQLYMAVTSLQLGQSPVAGADHFLSQNFPFC